MLAIEIERRLKLNRAQPTIPEESAMGNVPMHADCNASNYDTSAAIDSLIDDHSHTLRDDTITHTSQAAQNSVQIHSSTDESSSSGSDVHVQIKSSNIASLTLAIDSSYSSTTPKILTPNFSLHSSPSVDALDESRNISLYFTPTSGRESLSPISFHKSQMHPKQLIRSNSYTLDKPSPMLLKHMQSNGMNADVNDASHKSPMAMSRLRNKQNITTTGIPRTSSAVKTPSGAKLNASANKTGSKRQPSLPAIVFKNDEATLRSIYGQKLVPKVQHSNKKNKSSTSLIGLANESTAQPSSAHITKSNSSNPSQNTSNITNNGNKLSTNEYQQILAMFEQQQAALLKRQEEEQKRMQEEFQRQQEELLQTVKLMIAKKSNAQATPNGNSLNGSSTMERTKTSNEKMLIDEVNNQLPVIVDSNGNRVNRFTPESGKCIRRLCYDDNKLTNLNNNNNVDYNQFSPTKLSTDGSEQFEMHTVEEIQAANVIVAHAKGYLTRRLFKTTKVIDLQKMHHDTFELLIDISAEDNQNESKSEVEFKFHLLQQVIYHAHKE